MKATDSLDVHIGQRVRLRRVMVGQSQGELGKALGLTFQQVQKYEKGLNRIGAGRLYRIAEALSVTVGFFYEGLPDPSKGGISDPDTASETQAIHELLSTPEGFALCQHFVRITHAATRRRIVDLVSTVAEKG